MLIDGFLTIFNRYNFYTQVKSGVNSNRASHTMYLDSTQPTKIKFRKRMQIIWS